MSHNQLYKLLSLSICFFLSVSASAQTTTVDTKSNRENAPYSRFGIGELRNGLNPAIKGMGSISAAYSSPYAVNTDNPASYASLLLTTYEGGLIGSRRTISSGNDRFASGMATLNHMNIGVPVGKFGGLSFGYKPVSHIYFNLQDTSITNNYGNSVRTFFGDGSLNYAFLGMAGKYKGLSIGFNFGYLFGTTVYASRLSSIDTFNVSDAQFSQVLKVGGIYWEGGAQYEWKINDKYKLRAGATIKLAQDVKSTSDEFWIGFNASGGDTAFSSLNREGKFTMPTMYSAGLQLVGNDKWTVGVNYSGGNWSEYQAFGRVDSSGDMAYKIAAGGEYTPDPTSLRKYFSRVTYRIGAYYGQDYILLRNTPLNYYAVTFGFSLPFKRATDRIHAAFEIGNRGTETNGLFKESFFKATFGISLSDKWFIKRKYD